MKHKPFEHMKEITCLTDKSEWYWCDEYRAEIDRLTAQLAEKDQQMLEENLEVKRLESQLTAAHRQGWEQCQREVVKNILNAADPNILIQPSFTYRGIANMIASMEYKGAEK